jgi:MFS family permease
MTPAAARRAPMPGGPNPAIQSHLHASLAGIQWVANAYLLALAVSLITMGKLGDRSGHKTVFLTGATGFAAFSGAIGLSGDIAASIGLVIAFRAAQGLFGAMFFMTFYLENVHGLDPVAAGCGCCR